MQRAVPRQPVARRLTEHQRNDTPAGGDAARRSSCHDDTPIVWNRAAMIERMVGDENLAREILEAFLEDVARYRDPFDAALDADDPRGIERLAHSTKGAAGTLCADELQALAARVETVAKAGDLAALREFREPWNAALARLEAEIRRDSLIRDAEK